MSWFTKKKRLLNGDETRLVSGGREIDHVPPEDRENSISNNSKEPNENHPQDEEPFDEYKDMWDDFMNLFN